MNIKIVSQTQDEFISNLIAANIDILFLNDIYNN